MSAVCLEHFFPASDTEASAEIGQSPLSMHALSGIFTVSAFLSVVAIILRSGFNLQPMSIEIYSDLSIDMSCK
jgi:hypothetical protein